MIAASLLILTLLTCATPLLRRLGAAGDLIIALTPIGLGVWFATKLPALASGAAELEFWEWAPGLDVALSFRLDGLSLVFALLICFIGGLVLLYASSYLRGDPRLGSLLAKLLAFMVAMLGLVTADNLILLFIFWELTSVTSFLLIGFDHERERARRAAVQAMLVTVLGGLALLAGLVLLGVAAGSFELREIFGTNLRDHAFYPWIAVLVLLGALTKSAIFPFHFWLPDAMEAPSPVSALLHSATMVKAGVYLVARLHPVMSGPLIWNETLALLGGITMVGAAFLAVRQREFKRILAYSTVSSLGTMMLMLGLNAVQSASAYLLAHALFKGCLFLVAGAVTKRTGVKDPDRISRLHTVMPLTAAAGAVAALSMAGMFPLLGFVSKELLLKSAFAHPEWSLLAIVGTGVAGALTAMAAFLVGFGPCLGPAGREGDGKPIPSFWRMFAGPGILSAAGVIAGLAPWLFAEPLVTAMSSAIRGAPAAPARLRPIEMLWPPHIETALSVLILAVGAALYFGRVLFRRVTEPSELLTPIGPARMYERLYAWLGALAALSTRILQHGNLPGYVRVTLLAAVGTVVFALVNWLPGPHEWDVAQPITALDVLLAGTMIFAAIGCTIQARALGAVAVLGGVGLTIALIFALQGAPDLALTQFAVETLIVIIFVLVIFHLPRFEVLSGPFQRSADWVFASSLGLLMGGLTAIAASRQAPESISWFYSEHSVPEGYGRNIVNVILVDFRALDTLGEIFVIGVAAIGVFTLLRKRRSAAAGVSR